MNRSRYFLLHQVLKEGEAFELDPRWHILSATYKTPRFYLILLCPLPSQPPSIDTVSGDTRLQNP